MPVETNKWSQNGSATKEKDGDFGVFKLSSAASSIYAPMIPFKEEMINNHLTFSCYLKVADWSKFGGVTFVFCINENFVYNGTIRQTSGEVYLSGSGFNHPSKHGQATIERINNTWCKFIWTFKVVDGHPNNGGFFEYPSSGAISVNQAKYCTIGIIETGDDPGSGIQVKKMKLEYGNVSTEWSASPYDINYSTISGANLISTIDTSSFSMLKETKTLNSVSLKKNLYYTISWSSGTPAGLQITWKRKNSTNAQIDTGVFTVTSSKFEYTFSPSSQDWYLDLINTNTEEITFYEIKLEEGTNATGFLITAQQAQELATRQAELMKQNAINISNGNTATQILNLSEALYSIPTIGGGAEAFTNVDDFLEAINTYNSLPGEVSTIGGKIESTTQRVALTEEGLKKIENSIEIVSDANPPYIKIQASSATLTSSITEYLRLTPTRLEFCSTSSGKEEVVCYLSQNMLVIKNGQLNNAIVKEYFNIGGLNYKITETGVGIVWDTNFSYNTDV